MSHNDDQGEGLNALGEEENRLESITTTDRPSAEHVQEELMIIPNSSKIWDSGNKRHDPLDLKFLTKKQRLIILAG